MNASACRGGLIVVSLVLVVPFAAGVQQGSVVEGRVVEGLSQTPVSDAAVQLARRETFQIFATSRTDSGGNFSFRAVPSGTYDISVSKSGYVLGVLGQRRAGDRGHVLTVIDGTSILGLRVPIWKHATIAGQVVDAAGRRRSAVTVQAFGAVALGGRLVWLPQGRSSQTDNDGNFRLTSLLAGEYYVVAGQGFPGEIPPTIHPGTDRLSKAVPIAVVTGEDRVGANILLPSGPTFVLSGRLRLPAGEPVQAAIRLVVSESEQPNEIVAGVSRVGSDGAFGIPGVRPGEYVVEIYAAQTPTESPWSDQGQLERRALTRGPSVTRHVSVTAEDVVLPAVQMPGSFAIRGRITTDPSAAKTDQAIPKTPLYAISTDGRYSQAASQDRTGSFALASLAPGRYFLRFIGSLPSDWALAAITVSGAPAFDVPIVVDDSDIDDVIIRLTTRVSVLSGLVLSGTGVPDGHASVVAFPIDRSRWLDNGREHPRLRSARARADGTFVLRGLPPGDYFVVGLKEDIARNWNTVETLRVLESLASKVTVAEGNQLVLNVKSVAQLSNVAR